MPGGLRTPAILPTLRGREAPYRAWTAFALEETCDGAWLRVMSRSAATATPMRKAGHMGMTPKNSSVEPVDHNPQNQMNANTLRRFMRGSIRRRRQLRNRPFVP